MRTLILFLLLPFMANAQITPVLLANLDTLSESSGLLLLNNALWTHEDSGNAPELYQLDPNTGAILRTVSIANAPNVDWEDITSDGTHVYIGDVGNNAGNRTDLRILRFPASQLLDPTVSSVTVEVISFAYEDQTEFVEAVNANNWDCEALIARDDSLFLFTKNWLDQRTRLYALPAEPGSHLARYRGEYDVQGMVTAADLEPVTGEVVLLGYTAAPFVPFLCRLSGFAGNAFLSGTVVRETLSLAFVQMEAVVWNGPAQLLLSNEQSPFSAPRLWSIGLPTGQRSNAPAGGSRLFPNPASGAVRVEGLDHPRSLRVLDHTGRLVLSSRAALVHVLDVGPLAEGCYTVLLEGEALPVRHGLVVHH
jgi:hypothetical protein